MVGDHRVPEIGPQLVEAGGVPPMLEQLADEWQIPARHDGMAVQIRGDVSTRPGGASEIPRQA